MLTIHHLDGGTLRPVGGRELIGADELLGPNCVRQELGELVGVAAGDRPFRQRDDRPDVEADGLRSCGGGAFARPVQADHRVEEVEVRRFAGSTAMDPGLRREVERGPNVALGSSPT